MKKLSPYLLLALLMPALISSCKKDRNVEPLNVAEKWLFDKVVSEEYNAAGTVVNDTTFSDWTSNDYLALSSDGNFDLVQSGRRLTGIYAIENSVLSFSYNQINNANQIVPVTTKASIVEKTTSKFTFYVEEVSATGKRRATYYLLK
ncbi:MAG TPA: hypothetical protein VLZ28_09065 [Daejeonella sp.]|nr:hypothetical protein [Daejeonella sp.]